MNQRITASMVPYDAAIALLSTIPGVSTTIAHVLIAETGADMSRFPTAAHLASWAGVCPGHNESAGKVEFSHVRPGNSYLKAGAGFGVAAGGPEEGVVAVALGLSGDVRGEVLDTVDRSGHRVKGARRGHGLQQPCDAGQSSGRPGPRVSHTRPYGPSYATVCTRDGQEYVAP